MPRDIRWTMLDATDTSLDLFIQQWCHANCIDLGDESKDWGSAFGVMFSGQDLWTYGEAAAQAHETVMVHGDDIDGVAMTFGRIVRRDLAGHLPEILRRNREEYARTGACATHDFCDANELMAEAFSEAMRRPLLSEARAAAHDGPDPDYAADCDVWSRAWDQARRLDFGAEPEYAVNRFKK